MWFGSIETLVQHLSIQYEVLDHLELIPHLGGNYPLSGWLDQGRIGLVVKAVRSTLPRAVLGHLPRETPLPVSAVGDERTHLGYIDFIR